MTFTVESKLDWTAPVPAVDLVSKEFFAGVARGVLLLQRCDSCGHVQYYPRPMCVACAGSTSWIEVDPVGKVHTFTIVRQNGTAPFKDETPYVVAVIDHAADVKIFGNVTGCDVDDVHIGMDVEAYGVLIDEDIALLKWKPARAEGPNSNSQETKTGASR